MNKSFTLIEILVAIVVIGILSAFILVGMSSITSSANFAKGKAFFNSMDNVLLLGRVSQWRLDEAVGATTASDSWGANTGTLSGTVPLAQFQTTGCPSNNCLSFDGSDYVDCGSGSNLSFGSSSDFTISGWFKTSANYGYILSKGGAGGNNRYALCINNGKLTAYIQGAGGTVSLDSTVSVNNNIFNYGVASFDRDGNLTLYLNGVISGTPVSIISVGNINYANPFSIGARGAVDTFFTGSIDDIRVYNQAIPTSEIQQNYFLGTSKLFKNNGIGLNEFNEKIAELKSGLVFNK